MTGGRVLLTAIHAATGPKDPPQLGDDSPDRRRPAHGLGQLSGVAPDRRGQLHQPPIHVLPAADQQHPMLNEHRHQFGIFCSGTSLRPVCMALAIGVMVLDPG